MATSSSRRILCARIEIHCKNNFGEGKHKQWPPTRDLRIRFRLVGRNLTTWQRRNRKKRHVRGPPRNRCQPTLFPLYKVIAHNLVMGKPRPPRTIPQRLLTDHERQASFLSNPRRPHFRTARPNDTPRFPEYDHKDKLRSFARYNTGQ